MSRRGDREIGEGLAFVAFLFALAGVAMTIIAGVHHSFRQMLAAALCWAIAWFLLLFAMPPRWD